ncbi:dephospho-CoA kinase [Photorhabdus heterorhabditis]|uniref:Dephospho-CoA kinase n=1 Tax=Photorhabdus heterorhabditis TaxID=880156 RepID=A0A5B0X6S1_9GAMM|nr:dephospho-CoA kinase [Photorhabdus heterorhabditis]KAA1194976.1 dephospho-CoA kinase [Photorhabdus heterorhabditis]
MTYIIALTGGIGSGKTTIANAFAALGVPLVDADIIAREVVAPGTPALQAIKEHFGYEIITPNGSLNRTLLRQKIFTNQQEKQWINQLLHPLIYKETRRQLEQITAPYVIWVIPLLVENNLGHLADRILVVDVSPELQITRVATRDGISNQQVENILAAQVSRSERLAYADDIISNHDNVQAIAPRVAELHQQYLRLAGSARQDNHDE